MKIFVCTSRYLYGKAQPVIDKLVERGHEITLPNNFDDAGREDRMKTEHPEDYLKWKEGMFKEQSKKVEANDAILVLNFEKDGKPNYIGGATFLEIFKAWELGKKIYFYNPIPENILRDELAGMGPVILNGDLSQIERL